VVVRPEARDAHRPEGAGAWVEGGDGEPAEGAAEGGPPDVMMPRVASECVTDSTPDVANGRGDGGAWCAPTAGWETAVLRFGAGAGAAAGRGRVAESGVAVVGERSAGGEVALRLLAEPEVVRVECDAAGVPSVLWWRERRVALTRPSGPERLTGDWWKERYARDYWRCDGGGEELLLFQDRRLGGEWYVQGWYD